MIIGLPGEGEKEALETAKVILDSGAWGIKIHSLYVMEGTVLAEVYRQKRYTPPTLSEYTDSASEVIARLSPKIILHRITGDCPRNLLVAPEWNKKKSDIIDKINSDMKAKGYTQGCLFK
jgi:radical SAM superfamily enzyme